MEGKVKTHAVQTCMGLSTFSPLGAKIQRDTSPQSQGFASSNKRVQGGAKEIAPIKNFCPSAARQQTCPADAQPITESFSSIL